MTDIIVGVLAMLGTGLMLVAAIGLVRMPDLFTRMQVTAKATTLGAALVLAAGAVHFGEVSVASKAIAGVAFLIFTAPVAAHLLGRAAYFVGIPLWEQSVRDDLRGKYDPETHELEGDARARRGYRSPATWRAPD